MSPDRGRSHPATNAAWVAVCAVLAVAGTAVGAPATASGTVQVLATGDDARGQLGNGSGGATATPGPVPVGDAASVASGRDHGYALLTDGSVVAWGANDKGQVGDGKLVDRASAVPIGLSQVTGIEAGHYHGVAVRSDGTVWTWGYGGLGQLGNGGTANDPRPTALAGLAGITSAVAGRDSSYAVRNDGSVLAWGDNASGQVGDGTTARRLSPVPVPGLSDVVELAAGRNHVLAITADGRLWAWGDNTYGQVGDGSTVDRPRPVVVHPGPVRHVDAGAHHSIAVLDGGAVLTWGRGYRGQLGHGDLAQRPSPTVVTGLPAAVEVGDGRDTSFAVTAQGQVWAWGDNGAGQLGDATTGRRTSPVALAGVTDARSAQGGALHTYFLTAVADPANQPPTATFDVTCDLLLCQFTSTAVDPDGTVVAVSWDHGDGSSASGTSVEHEYAAPGRFTVTSSVRDDDGALTQYALDVVVDSGTPPPDVVHVGAAGATANTTSARVVLPPETQGGDLVLVFVTANRTTTATGPTGAGTGWDNLQVATSASNDMRAWAWATTAAPGDAGRTVSIGFGVRSKHVVTAVVHRGGHVVASGSAVETVTTAQHRSPVLDVGGPTKVISYWSDKSNATTGWTPPSGVVERVELAGSGSGRVTSMVGESGPSGPGSVGGLVATATSASRKAVSMSVALAPSS